MNWCPREWQTKNYLEKPLKRLYGKERCAEGSLKFLKTSSEVMAML